MLFRDTPYKVVKYLAKLSREKVLTTNFQNENYIRYLIDRNLIKVDSRQLSTTRKFDEILSAEIESSFNDCCSFIVKYDLTFIENHYSIGEIESLMKIEKEREEIIYKEISLQNILSKYFGSSKHKSAQSNLSKAIKAILGIDMFPEESKDQQYISILYPKVKTRFIILCENKNRLINPRHEFIEFWFAGGKNTKQLQFIPKPRHPIFYLFDWDPEGLETYIQIRKNYFESLKAFIPSNFETIKVKRDDAKDHKSNWKNNAFIEHLDSREKAIVISLINSDSIIVEQNILLSKENLVFNSIN